MKRVICSLFALLVLCLCVTAASADTVNDINYGFEGAPECDAVYLEELNTGTVVYEYYADERYRDKLYPASTTKVMTYIIVAENVADLDGTKIEITYDSLSNLDPESSVMGLEYHVGQSFSVRDLLYGLMLPSGNDAALVLAGYVGGSVDAFVDMMNSKAEQLGCTGTHFTSPHGLYDPDHYTTLKDLAAITKYAMKDKNFMEICNTVSYLPEGFNEPIKTTNFLLDKDAEGGTYYYPDAKGIKTGYTDEAGKCLISTAERDGCRYLCLAMGADYSYMQNVNYAMLDTIDLYDWAFGNLSVKTAYDSTDVLKSLPVEYVWGNKMLDLVPESPVTALLSNDYDTKLISITTDYTRDTAQAPVKKGDVYGTMTVYYNDKILGKTNIIAAEDIERQESNYVIKKTTDFIGNHIVLFIAGILVLIILIVLIIHNIRRKKARQRRRNRARGTRGM